MKYQKYETNGKTVYYDPCLKKVFLNKTKHTITFPSLLEYKVYRQLECLAGCEISCHVPLKGQSFGWNVDFKLRAVNLIGLKTIRKFRQVLGMAGQGSVYIEAKGIISKDFAKKLNACRQECPNVYKNLVAFGDSPLGVVFEENLDTITFPIRSLRQLRKIVLFCNSNEEVE